MHALVALRIRDLLIISIPSYSVYIKSLYSACFDTSKRITYYLILSGPGYVSRRRMVAFYHVISSGKIPTASVVLFHL
jgi:uncharacterized membrane protein